MKENKDRNQEIRRIHKKGKIGGRKLGKMFGISHQRIYQILLASKKVITKEAK